MNDPKGTDKGELQTTGQTSQGTEGTSQDTTPETLTRDQYQKLLSDEKAKMGRELKTAKLEAEQYKSAHSKLEGELTQTREQMSDIQRRIDEAEEEEAKGSPESLRLYQKARQLREKEAAVLTKERAIEKERLENAEELRTAKESRTEMSIISAAVEHHVDIGRLKEKVQTFGLTTEEQISELAETLAGQAVDGKKIPPKGDSGMTIGGVGLGSLSPKEMLKEIDNKLRKQ